MKASSTITLPAFSKHEAVDEIKRIAREESSSVDLLDHARERMVQRGITTKQIFNVLKNGQQVGDVRWDSKKEPGWRCTLRRITAGVEVTVVAKLVTRENSTCLVVTTWGEEES